MTAGDSADQVGHAQQAETEGQGHPKGADVEPFVEPPSCEYRGARPTDHQYRRTDRLCNPDARSLSHSCSPKVGRFHWTSGNSIIATLATHICLSVDSLTVLIQDWSQVQLGLFDGPAFALRIRLNLVGPNVTDTEVPSGGVSEIQARHRRARPHRV